MTLPPARCVSGFSLSQSVVPRGAFSELPLLRDNALYTAEALPIVAVHYLMALRAPNAPIGIGFLAWVGALASIWWPYGRAPRARTSPRRHPSG